MKGIYYNENDPRAAAWLRELIAVGVIARGEVDERSIAEVKASDLSGFAQCHFFAGIGGWSYALRLAGWPDERPVWTGSCPCQPFSAAGKQHGEADKRHLWPEFRRLIEIGRPARVFGEQVASRLGRQWLARVRADLEALGYGVGAADLCAASKGAPHIRQRLYWMADAGRTGHEFDGQSGNASGESSKTETAQKQRQRSGSTAGDCREDGRLANMQQPGLEGHAGNGDDRNQSGRERENEAGPASASGGAGGMEHAAGSRRERQKRDAEGQARNEARLRVSCQSSETERLGDPEGGGRGEFGDQPGRSRHLERADWARFDLIPCRDGKARRVESGTFPLVNGIPDRVGLLRGYGNAIVPQVAAEFIRACEGT